MKPLKTKFILLLTSATLLVAVVLYMTYAWYTKMVSVSGMDFRVAKWDFTANQTVDNMSINVYEYSSLNGNCAAPGTAGYIPIQLGTGDSDTDVEYYITVDKSSMSQEFQDRIFFYYENEDGEKVAFENEGEDLKGEIPRGATETVNVYWEWIYELELEPDGASGAYTEEQRTLIEKHNEFDTRVGKNPYLYVPYMNATIKVAGAQVTPTLMTP